MKCPRCETLMERLNSRGWCPGNACGHTLGADDIPALFDEIAKWRALYHTARNERDVLIAENKRLQERIDELDANLDYMADW